MPHNFFISHYNNDKQLAEILSNALRRITLDQLCPWFSSDTIGGLKPGELWFNEIMSRIQNSKAVVTVLTPNSINRPWIYFESGIAHALPACEVIPICFGIKRDDILPPLSLYQIYQPSDYRSCVEFFSKLLNLFNIKFDEQMSKPVIKRMVSEISKIKFEGERKGTFKNQAVEDMLQDLKSHIDKRFIELIEPSNQVSKKVDSMSYSVEFHVAFPGYESDIFVDIREGDTFQDVTNSIYFTLSDHLAPFTYLEKWCILNKEDNKHIIIREVADQIPARFIFKPNVRWTIEMLKSPYNATDSSSRVL